MNNVLNNNWNSQVLNNATLIRSGSGFMETYDLHNGNILKVVKGIEQLERDDLIRYYRMFQEELNSKINLSKYIDIPDIVLPNNAYYSEEGIKAYTVPKVINGLQLEQILPKINSLRLYGAILSKLTKRIRTLNENGIILPDLITASNIFYDYKSDSFNFIDYDGMQIWYSKSFSISNCLFVIDGPINNTEKYGNYEQYTSNLDKLSLLILFFCFTNGINIIDRINEQLAVVPELDLAIEMSLNKLGIEKCDYLHIAISQLYSSDENCYPDQVFDRFSNEYQMYKEKKKVRRFFK